MDIEKYFERIGFTGTPEPTEDVLREIHHLHPLAIPFENLGPFLGGKVSLAPAEVFDKLVLQGRGGYCFEQNLLLAEMLRATGFDVSTHAARVVWQGIEKQQAPRTHMLLKVRLDDTDFIADVGFGGLTMTAPLRLEDSGEQQSPHETLRISRDDEDYLISVKLRDDWKAMYVFDLSTQRAPDFELANYFVATHPESRFVNNLILARPFRNGRHAFFNNTYVKYSRDGQKTEKSMDNPGEVITLLEDIFKIRLESRVDKERLEKRVAGLIAART